MYPTPDFQGWDIFILPPNKKEETVMSEENLYTFENPEYRKTFWHTCSHIMAQAVNNLWPETKLAIGPSIADGFYYDLMGRRVGFPVPGNIYVRNGRKVLYK